MAKCRKTLVTPWLMPWSYHSLALSHWYNSTIIPLQDEGKLRRWRTLVAVSHIGVSITSSALTTIVAAIPLTQTTIQPFSKFGQIVTINTSVSITYTCTACVAMLALMAPAKFTNSWRSVLIATVATATSICVLTLILYILSQCGLNIPAPNGENLFWRKLFCYLQERMCLNG